MRCEKFQNLLDAYADGVLTENEALKVAEHLRHCSVCQLRWQEIQKLNRLLDDTFANFHPLPSQILRQRIEQTVFAQRLTSKRKVTVRRPAAIFAVALVGLIVVIASLMHQPPLPSYMEHRERKIAESQTKIAKVEAPPKPPELKGKSIQTPKQQFAPSTDVVCSPSTVKRVSVSLAAKPKVKRQAAHKRVIAKLPEGNEPIGTEHSTKAVLEALETLLKKAEPRNEAVLISVERVIPIDPTEPVPPMIVYRVLDAPIGREVTVMPPQGAIVQPISVTELTIPSLSQQ